MEKLRNNIKQLNQLIEDIQNVDIFKNGNEWNYKKIYTLVTDYTENEEEFQDYELHELICHHFVTFDTLQDTFIYEIKHEGLRSLIEYLNGVNLEGNIFRVKYNKCYDLTISDIEFLKVELLKEINKIIEERQEELKKKEEEREKTRALLIICDDYMKGTPQDLTKHIVEEIKRQSEELEKNFFNLQEYNSNIGELMEVLQMIDQHNDADVLKFRYNPMGCYYLDDNIDDDIDFDIYD